MLNTKESTEAWQTTTMAKTKKKKLRPGVGAKGTIVAKFVHPRDVMANVNGDEKGRIPVVLKARADMTVSKRKQVVYLFNTDVTDATDLYAVKGHFVLDK